jgi:UDP-2,3-diacylglucosamine pyrophosphatase LpxH
VYAFIADIHLRPDAGKDAHRFISWISSVRAHAKAVYILGDLFDYWYTGLENRFQVVFDALNSPKIHLMTGNRDFLLRNTPLSNLQILPAEEIRIQVGNARLLLAHGHTLTQADLGFRLLHSFGWPALKVLDRVLPLDLKHHLARFLVKSSATIRPSSLTIREGIEANKGVETVICGHLHRYIERPGLIVLPAFFDSGQWLSWGDSGPGLQTFP